MICYKPTLKIKLAADDGVCNELHENCKLSSIPETIIKNFPIIYSVFDLPLSTPVSLDALKPEPILTKDDCEEFKVLKEFIYESDNIILGDDQVFEKITNGHANYR